MRVAQGGPGLGTLGKKKNETNSLLPQAPGVPGNAPFVRRGGLGGGRVQRKAQNDKKKFIFSRRSTSLRASLRQSGIEVQRLFTARLRFAKAVPFHNSWREAFVAG